MRDDRLVTIDRLEQQEIRDLRSPTTTARHCTGRERLALLMQQPLQLSEKRHQARTGSAMKNRRKECVLKDHALIRATLDDVRERDARKIFGSRAVRTKLRV